MLLVIDVGNSNIVLGVYDGKELLHHFRITTDRFKTADEYAMSIQTLFSMHDLKMQLVDAIIISSVVPPLIVPLERMCVRYFQKKPLIVGPGIKTGIKLHYENPREIGSDRIVNVVGAYEVFGGDLIVIDIGTATTFDIVDSNGDFLGGVIAPGIGTTAEALVQKTAKLPRIELVTPKTVIGKNTIAGMQAGIIFGYVGQLDELVRRITAELGRKLTVIATGGYATMIAKESQTIDLIDHFLTLTGLRVLYERNAHKVK